MKNSFIHCLLEIFNAGQVSLALTWLLIVLLLITLSYCAKPLSSESSNLLPTHTFGVTGDQLESSIDPASIPKKHPNDCPKLDSQLFQLTQADDPLAQAEQKGLRVMDGKIQVLFVLVNPDASFLLDYGVELGSQSANQVQGFATIERLCELANLDAVLAIKPPAKAIIP